MAGDERSPNLRFSGRRCAPPLNRRDVSRIADMGHSPENGWIQRLSMLEARLNTIGNQAQDLLEELIDPTQPQTTRGGIGAQR